MAHSPAQSEQVPTRDKILEAAEKLFVEKGFADTSVSRIAKEAGVTKSLIHHHFGSKEQLWKTVKHNRLGEYFDDQKRELDITQADIQCLKDSIVRFFALFKVNPQLSRLFSWHLIEGREDTDDAEFELMGMAVEKLLQAQREGTLRADVDVRFAIVAFLCLVQHWFAGKHEYVRWFGVEPDAKDIDETYLETMIKIFFEGVAPRSADCRVALE